MPGSGVRGSGMRYLGLNLKASRSTPFTPELHTFWGLWDRSKPPPHPEPALLRLRCSSGKGAGAGTLARGWVGLGGGLWG